MDVIKVSLILFLCFNVSIHWWQDPLYKHKQLEGQQVDMSVLTLSEGGESWHLFRIETVENLIVTRYVWATIKKQKEKFLDSPDSTNYRV